MSKEIITYFSSLKEAERYQNRLYNKWDFVQLVQFPIFGESEKYVWHVKN